jgi:hypothetical protein
MTLQTMINYLESDKDRVAIYSNIDKIKAENA